MTRQMELCRVDAQGISEEGEALGAAKRAREEERLRTMMSKASAYKGGEASQWGGKTRKGKRGGRVPQKGSHMREEKEKEARGPRTIRIKDGRRRRNREGLSLKWLSTRYPPKSER